MHLDLKDAMQKAGADADVRAIILTGAGRGFCAGADMGGLQAIGAGAPAVDRSTKAGRRPAGRQHPGRIPDDLFLLPGDPEIHHRRHQRAGGGPGLRHPALRRPALRRRIGGVHHRLRPARPDRRAWRELAAAAAGRPAGGARPALLGPQVPRARGAVARAGEPGHPRRQADGRDPRLCPAAGRHRLAALGRGDEAPALGGRSSRPWPRRPCRPTTRWSSRSRPPTSRKASPTSSRSARRGSPGKCARPSRSRSRRGCQVIRRRSTSADDARRAPARRRSARGCRRTPC